MAPRLIDTDLLGPLLQAVAALLASERTLHTENGEPIAVKYILLGLWASTTSKALKDFCERYPDLRPIIDMALPEETGEPTQE